MEEAASFTGYAGEIADLNTATTAFDTVLQNQQSLDNQKQAATVTG